MSADRAQTGVGDEQVREPQCRPRAGGQGRDAALDVILLPHVVLVAEGDEVTGGGGQQLQEAARRAEILTGAPLHARVTPGVGGQDLGGGVGRAVVARGDDQVGMRLGENAVELVGEPPLAVVRAQQDLDAHPARMSWRLPRRVPRALVPNAILRPGWRCRRCLGGGGAKPSLPSSDSLMGLPSTAEASTGERLALLSLED